MIANAVGSFALGVVMELGEGRTIYGVDARLPLGVGLLGGFTTYSSFNLEVLKYWDQGQLGRAAAYSGGTFILCLIAGFAGLAVARAVKSGG
jgi:CrcB protein